MKYFRTISDPDKARELFAKLSMQLHPDHGGDADAFREMKQIDPAVKVLMVSGYSQEESPDLFRKEQPDAFLQKPFRPEELNAKLRGVLMRGQG